MAIGLPSRPAAGGAFHVGAGMAQQKKTDVAEAVDVDALEPLTDPEREFAHLIVREGAGPSDAYKRTHDTEHLAETSIWTLACRLKATSRVQMYMDALYRAGAHSGMMSQMEFVRDMLALAARAEKAGNYGAAVNARAQAGKVSGLYIEQVRDVTEEADIGQLLDAIEELAGSEARKTAARRLGVDEPGAEPPTDTRH